MIHIDGSKGEGGGQVLRSSLALSMVTGQPFTISKIRAGRKKPGLLRQHLTAVKAAKEVSGAKVTGAEMASTRLTFAPGPVVPGSYRFSVGTAGSCTLVFQTVLPALICADGPSELSLEGGTHNPFAPPFEFLKLSFLPQLERIGPRVEVELQRPGFYPAGGGAFTARIEPSSTFSSFDLSERGALEAREASAVLSRLPTNIGERELQQVVRKLNWPKKLLHIREVGNSPGPGNVIMLMLQHEQVCEVFTGYGEKNLPADKVANDAIRQLKDYLKSEAPVGPYLADQLMIPLAMAGGGSFRCTRLTRHAVTNIETIREFLDVKIDVTELEDKSQVIRFG